MKKCGLLGNNIQYSKSPFIHNKYYSMHNLPVKYEIFDIDKCELESFVNNIHVNNIIGFNVTIPYKETIIKYLNKLEYPADKIKAVNTVVVIDKKLIGYNTDFHGFIKSIKEFNINLEGKNALIIGGGGAAKAIFYALKDLMCMKIDLAVRDIDKVKENFQGISEFILINDDNNYCKYDIIVNCTPLGGANYLQFTPINVKTIKKGCIVYDLVYNPEKTRFLQEAETNGAIIFNGESMLKHQAYISADLWIKEHFNLLK
ncbi:shikimate dehydrogenase [Clostridium sp. SYSU_GA19001]|uniref:shikimate dehydrogenase n=1 Tax=Clostridium caldaquaticum TaxID=2940653 RepID=UPI002076F8B4|nr:shikimate dehydrogenase [Clostridium caldaquaticum]MCM8710472.1 shikimate dehydrogenase [Clostridium caldaquaticum]